MQVAWTLLKNVRKEDNMYEQFVRTTAMLQHHYNKSVAELRCAENSKLKVPARLVKVCGECKIACSLLVRDILSSRCYALPAHE